MRNWFIITDTISVTPFLYTPHFLSMWNSRAFEFGAILSLATIYPGTLLPMSIYALLRSLAAIALSPAIWSFIDSGQRLPRFDSQFLGSALESRFPVPFSPYFFAGKKFFPAFFSSFTLDS